MAGYDVILQDAGRNKIAVIKEIRELTNCGLKEAKDLSEQTPSVILHTADDSVAERARSQLERAGATVSVDASSGEPSRQQVSRGLAAAGLDASGWRAEPGQFDVILEDTGRMKIEVIKRIREISDLGLKEAKDVSEATPSVILSGVDENTAYRARQHLEDAGARVALKSGDGAVGVVIASPLYDVMLVSGGVNARKVAKVIKEHARVGNREANNMAGQTNVTLMRGASESAAFAFKSALEAEGALVDIRQNFG